MMLMEPFFSFNQPTGEPHTPKVESSFYDPRVTWDTSDPYASSPEFLRTPQHRFGLNTPSNPLKYPEDTDTAKRIRPSKPNGNLPAEDAPRTVGSAKSAASMQTPPPSSASRRKVLTGLEDYNQDATTGPDASSGPHLETPSRLWVPRRGCWPIFSRPPICSSWGISILQPRPSCRSRNCSGMTISTSLVVIWACLVLPMWICLARMAWMPSTTTMQQPATTPCMIRLSHNYPPLKAR